MREHQDTLICTALAEKLAARLIPDTARKARRLFRYAGSMAAKALLCADGHAGAVFRYAWQQQRCVCGL